MDVETVTKYVEDNILLDSDDHIVTKELWDGRYRVNVWKYDPKNAIVKSFFIQTDESGVILCSPQIGA